MLLEASGFCYNRPWAALHSSSAASREVSMPLLDHFHPPLLGQRHWEAFHGWWAAAIASRLNDHLLPPEYFAEFQVTVGSRIEVEVATFSENGSKESTPSDGAGTATALQTQTQLWAPPVPTAVMPAVFPDDFEIQVFNSAAGPTLVAAIDLVSPGNKDRDETRGALAAKYAAYLYRGIGLLVVDIVTSRHANLHDELIDLLRLGGEFPFPAPTSLYATAYRPAHRQDRNEIRPVARAAGGGATFAGLAAGGSRARVPTN
jgi:hypothetical protein